MMTRKHYVILAAALKEAREHTYFDGDPFAALCQFEDTLIELLKEDNPRFDEDRFRKFSSYDKELSEC